MEYSKTSRITHKVYFEIEQDGQALGVVTIGLFGAIVPRTVQNFRELTISSDPKFGYRNSVFHRVVPDFCIQGGDFQSSGQGYGGYSIYGRWFKDENFMLNHDRPYRLSMANFGKDTNGSQFIITTDIAPWLDGKQVVFGEVIDGFNVIDAIMKTETGPACRPVSPIKIVHCGELPVAE